MFESSPHSLAGTRVILALSGGVDSAVAAILLQQAGADLHALHMTNWEDDEGYCTSATDLQDARSVCEQLDIPLHHVNFAREYRDQVFAYFLDEYQAGRTPNPDVLCNREIKFGVFRRYAQRLGGKFMATGHYVRTETVGGETRLLKAKDPSKDQSYFLHAVSGGALADTLFPLGRLHKSEVRAIAREHALEVYDKKDSTGICFIGERPFREFLARFMPANPGPMRTPDGRKVGEHHGLMYYTLGQRQGLGIGGRKDGSEEPWYVAAKDIPGNALIVVQGKHPLRFSRGLKTAVPHWINAMPASLSEGRPLACTTRIRYRQPDQRCTVIAATDGTLQVAFEQEQADVTPGQFAVFYDGGHCLGGAAIECAVHGEAGLPKAG